MFAIPQSALHLGIAVLVPSPADARASHGVRIDHPRGAIAGGVAAHDDAVRARSLAAVEDDRAVPPADASRLDAGARG